jgi:hypothetical protein
VLGQMLKGVFIVVVQQLCFFFVADRSSVWHIVTSKGAGLKTGSALKRLPVKNRAPGFDVQERVCQRIPVSRPPMEAEFYAAAWPLELSADGLQAASVLRAALSVMRRA